MVSLEPIHGSPASIDAPCSPRISFSAEFLDENNFISITPNLDDLDNEERERVRHCNAEFDFLSSNNSLSSDINTTMLSADELFFEGKLLPFWQTQHSEILSKINLKSKDADLENNDEELTEVVEKEENNNSIRVNWFVDDDPSPRPPKCTVLLEELLKLKKQRDSSLSPSSSSSSSRSSSSRSLADGSAREEDGKEGSGINTEKQYVKKIKKGLERTRSVSIRIKPIVSVPICTQVKSSTLPPLFPLKKGRISER